ncbi:PREDICTED: polygalacturonase QRT3-like [Fragaria vesca subsp. vesca]|uniref:polygalacturonase QRT3-like n=1 Tax=Fragaria vesca subsp. vesca TaxID=101020 RepID=UPI0002C32907|nr:PREDICTED: polygalacturonase QRT3-like [Fragaria vesca subsp. vesca]
MISLLPTLVKLLMGFLCVVFYVNHGDSSYPSPSTHDPIRRMALMKASLQTLRTVAASTPQGSSSSSSRVHHATEYGADPTGISDSTEALQQAISDAFISRIEGTHLMEGIADLGGTQLHLDGGTYKISRPLRLPDTTGAGNFMLHGGSLLASHDFPTDRHMIELWSKSNSFMYEDITLKDLMINSNFRGGGIAVINSLRTTIDNCYISRFTSNGILIQGGHETFVTNSFIGQHINVGGDHREKNFSGIGININGNDNSVSDVVIFSAAVGIMVQGQANIFTGVHCYNKATGWGGIGIHIRSPGLTQTRILNSYFDFTGIVAEDPVQLHISGSFFLGNAFVMIKSLKGVMSGLTIVDNMFSGDYTGVQIVQFDQSNGHYFTTIDQVVVDRNVVRGMILKTTVAKGSKWSNGTKWTVDFSKVLLFPDLIQNVQYTLQAAGSSFPNHILRNVSHNCVTVESDVPVSATLHVLVDQSMLGYV